MAREWAFDAYKMRLDTAIGADRWDEADRIRVSVKRRLLEMVSKGGGESEIAAARDGLADSLDRLSLSKRVRIDKGALVTAARLSADAETAGIAAEQVPLPHDTARDVKERIVQILSGGNRRPWSTSELARETGHRVETVARAVSLLRADRKIISRRAGRFVLHRVPESRPDNFSTVLNATTNAPVLNTWIDSQKKGATKIVAGLTRDGGFDSRGFGSGVRVLSYTLKNVPSLTAEANANSGLRVLLDEIDSSSSIGVDEISVIKKKLPYISRM